MNVRLLGGFIALWGAAIVLFRFIGDSDQALGEPITRGDVGILIFGWILLGVGLYLLVRDSKGKKGLRCLNLLPCIKTE
jgi:hypothetical protein